MKFHIVDVFAETKYSGNQLAVFLCREQMAAAEMQRFAREINFSESVFVEAAGERGGGWPARIFTPRHEVDFAGHPTLGAAHVIRCELLKPRVRRISLLLKIGLVPVDFSPQKEEPLFMDQVAPVFGGTLPADALAEVLSLPQSAIDGRFPIQEVSTGLPHIIVPLGALDSLQKIEVDRGRYFRLIEKTWAKNILAFCLQGRSPSHQVSVRMFADYLGIAEDPATGSGNGCLAGYLVKHLCLGTPTVSICAGQGHEIGRPSLLYLQAEERQGTIHVRVGGKVMDVAAGEWLST